MFNKKHISFIIAILTLVSTYGMAQVKKNQSRLEIGRNAKASTFNTNLISSPLLISNKIPKEVKLNKAAAINQYYKTKLIQNSTKKTAITSVNYTESNDSGFKNDKISISNIYPNPANDYATLEYKFISNVKSASVNVYNVLGTEIAQLPLDKQEESIKIATRNWDNGVYLYQVVIDNKKVLTKKLIVRHN